MADPARILVTGAAGKTGLAVLAALREKGTVVRALVHRESQIETVKQAGVVDVVVGDMAATAVWTKAMTGMTAVYHICPNMHSREEAIGERALAAAQAAGVSHFVYHSVLHPQTESMPHHWHKLRVEARLFASGLNFTILQPAAYMQNVLAGWQAIKSEAVVRVPYPVDTRFSLVDLTDVAQVAALVLTNPEHAGAIYELAGPQILTPAEMAQEMSAVLGRPVTAVTQSLAAWQEQAEAAGLSGYAQDTLLKMFRYYARNGFWANGRVLRWLLGRDPTTFRQFLTRLQGVMV